MKKQVEVCVIIPTGYLVDMSVVEKMCMVVQDLFQSLHHLAMNIPCVMRRQLPSKLAVSKHQT